YLCTKMLYKYGQEKKEDKFNHLWDNQSINDKGIRNHFVRQFTSSRTEKKSFTPLQVFNPLNISYNRTEDNIHEEHCWKSEDLNNYLLDALRKKDPRCVHLASYFALYSKQQLNSSCMKHHIRYAKPVTFFLFEACKD